MFFAGFSQYLEYFDRMKLSIDEMILMIGPTKVFMESKLSDNFLLELLPLKSKNLTRWAIQAPGSLLFSWSPYILPCFSISKEIKFKLHLVEKFVPLKQ